MGTITLQWICPECGCGDCAEGGITCGCCGNFSFIPGDFSTVSSQFYNSQINCPICHTTLLGPNIDSSCQHPKKSGNELTWLGPGIHYRYIDRETNYWSSADILDVALIFRAPGSPIYDSCGNEIEIEE